MPVTRPRRGGARPVQPGAARRGPGRAVRARGDRPARRRAGCGAACGSTGIDRDRAAGALRGRHRRSRTTRWCWRPAPTRCCRRCAGCSTRTTSCPEGVHAFRTMDDCLAPVRGRTARASRAVVIGGGLLGVSAARALAAARRAGGARPAGRAPDGAPARPGRLGAAAAATSRSWASRCTPSAGCADVRCVRRRGPLGRTGRRLRPRRRPRRPGLRGPPARRSRPGRRARRPQGHRRRRRTAHLRPAHPRHRRLRRARRARSTAWPARPWNRPTSWPSCSPRTGADAGRPLHRHPRPHPAHPRPAPTGPLDLAAFGETDPLPGDDVVQLADATRGTYRKVVVRGDRLVGGVLARRTRHRRRARPRLGGRRAAPRRRPPAPPAHQRRRLLT